MSAEGLGLLAAAGVLFGALLRATAPLLLAALGGLMSELAGVVNVALEGLILIAAFFGVLGSALLPIWLPQWPPQMVLVAAVCMGLAASVLAALLLGVVHIEFDGDIIVAGIGVNLLAAGLTVFLMVIVSGDKGSTSSLTSAVLPGLVIPGLEDWPVLSIWLNGEAGLGHHVLIYVAFAAVAVVALVLFSTPLGLRLRAVGENHDCARAAGLPVRRLQYTALACSGVLAGLGGLYLSMGYLSVFQADMSAGRGFLALAAVYLGARRPLGVLWASLLFAAASVAAAQLGLLQIPSQAVFMVAPLVTIAAMVIAANRRRQNDLNTRRRALARLRAHGPSTPTSTP
jgi:general nucleoside transport system permease protein